MPDGAFDAVAARLDYPMYVVTAYDGTERAGCLVGFTTQCSIDPPRFLVCLSEKNHTFRVARGAPALAVHVLTAEHRATAELFGSETGDEVDKFARTPWREGPDGVPVLDDAAAWFAGRVVDRVPLGDHTGYLLEPYAGEVRGDVAPLTFQDLRDLDPGHDA
jgi:flavin reductase (DIM6/NTAB) family NADH-FMN oxidoreductase RutF